MLLFNSAPCLFFYFIFLLRFKYFLNDDESIFFGSWDLILDMSIAKLITKEGLAYCSKYAGYPAY